MSSYQR